MSSVMPIYQNHSRKHGFPLRFFAAAFGISILATGSSVWELWYAHNRVDERAGKHIAIKERVRASLAEPYLLAVQQEGGAETTVEHHCTSSIGVALFINHEGSPEDILKWADMAMYQAKEGGRNMIRFYDSKS